MSGNRVPVRGKPRLMSVAVRFCFRPVPYSWTLALVQGSLLIAASYWLQIPPSSGVAVVALTLVPIIMAIRPEEGWGRPERIGWLVLAVVLSFVAVHSIRKEDDDRNQEFASIISNYKNTIQIMNSQFQQSMKAEESILGATRHAANLSEENLANISGEGSVPCIVPQSHAVIRGVVPLVIWNKGRNNLTGVEVRLLSEAEFLRGGPIFYKPAEELGTLRYEWPKPLPKGVLPVPGADGVAHYIADIWTQNGFYTEVINFRRGKYALPWAYEYWLARQVPFRVKNGPGMKGEPVKSCVQSKWSDDLGDGKPVSKP